MMVASSGAVIERLGKRCAMAVTRSLSESIGQVSRWACFCLTRNNSNFHVSLKLLTLLMQGDH